MWIIEQQSSVWWSSGNGFTLWPAALDGDFMMTAAVIVYRAGRSCHFLPRSHGVEWSSVDWCVILNWAGYLYFSLFLRRVREIKRVRCCCSPTGARRGCRTGPDQLWFTERWGDGGKQPTLCIQTHGLYAVTAFNSLPPQPRASAGCASVIMVCGVACGLVHLNKGNLKHLHRQKNL